MSRGRTYRNRSRNRQNLSWSVESDCRKVAECLNSSIPRNANGRKPAVNKFHNISNQTQYVKLLQWMKLKSGFTVGRNLQPANFRDTGRGLVTKKPIKKGDVLLSIPVELLITTRTVMNSSLALYIQRVGRNLSPMQALSLFLMFERVKNEKSEWFPYLTTLPISYSTPAFFRQSDIEMLPKQLQDKVYTQLSNLQRAFEGLKQVIDLIELDLPKYVGMLTWDLYIWAWFTINTRAIYILIPHHSEFLTSEPDHYALAPFLDLLNHSPFVQVEAGFHEKDQSFKIISLTPYKKYHQVFINYGPHDNYKLVLEYGFFVPGNPQHSVQVNLSELLNLIEFKTYSEKEKKMLIISQENLTKDLSYTVDGASWSLHRTFMVLSLNQEELKDWRIGGVNCVCIETEERTKNLARNCQDTELMILKNKQQKKAIASSNLGLVSDLIAEDIRILSFAKEKYDS